LDPVISISVAYALAVLWLVGAVQKVTGFKEFCATVREYRVLPKWLAAPSAAIVIGLEIGLGIALVTPIGRSLALGGSAGLMMLYAAAIGVNLLRGRRHIDCGCMGPGYRQPLSEWLVGRNLVLATAALAALLPVESRALVWVDAISIGASICVLAAFYATANRLIVNARELKSPGS
jgi:uncharacterized membrane protein